MRSEGAYSVLVVITILCSCRDRVDDFGIDVSPPEVVRFEPSDGSTGIDRLVEPRIIFSEPMDPSTITSETIGLFRDGTLVSGAVGVTSTAAVFSPEERLDDLATYELRVNGVADLAGLRLEAPAAASFETEDLTWGAPFAVSGTAGTFTGFGAVDGCGNVMLVWNDIAGVWSQRIIAGVPDVETLVDSATTPLASGLGVADDGTAITIWIEQSGSRFDLWWSQWDPAMLSWSPPALLETDDSGSVGNARLSVNGAGFAVAAWNQNDGMSPPFRANIYAREYSPRSGWGPLRSLENRTETAEPPQVAIAANANAVVTWAQSNGTATRIWAAYYAPFDGWTNAETVDSGGVTAAQAKIDAAANAYVLWGGDDRAFNRHVEGVGWSGPTPFGDSSDATSVVALALNEAAPDRYLAWNERNAGIDEILVSELSEDGEVGSPVSVATTAGMNMFVRGAGVDGTGRAFVIWSLDVESRPSLAAARFRSGGWTGARLLETDDVGTVASLGSVDVGPGGEAVVLYFRNDGVTEQLWGILLR